LAKQTRFGAAKFIVAALIALAFVGLHWAAHIQFFGNEFFQRQRGAIYLHAGTSRPTGPKFWDRNGLHMSMFRFQHLGDSL
jgi:hypothetical protein